MLVLNALKHSGMSRAYPGGADFLDEFICPAILRKTRNTRCLFQVTDPVLQLLEDILGGHRLTVEEGTMLMSVRDRRVWDIASAADKVREKVTGNQVTYVRNQNVNVTNICINTCGFCGFSKKPGDSGTFLFSPEEIREKAALARKRNVTEICTVSGLHPDFDASSYTGIISTLHTEVPGIHIHASNPMEIAFGAKKSGITTGEMLVEMKEAGLGSLCGTAAEILVDEVRKVICPGKISTLRMGENYPGSAPAWYTHNGNDHVWPL